MSTLAAPLLVHPGIFRRILIPVLFLGLPLVAAAQASGWLLFDAKSGDAVMVSDPGEKNRLLDGPWQVDGHFQYLAPGIAGAKALHRLARPGADRTDRMFSTDPDEVHALVSTGFADEGVLGFVLPAGAAPRRPVYRYRKGDHHLWLMGDDGRKWAEAVGWKSEGPAFWVDPPDAP